MYETVTLEECVKGEADPCSWKHEESKYKWYTEQQGNTTVLYANFRGKNPNEEKVEIAVRRNVFMPDKNGVNYITVSGFVLTKAATTWAPPAAYQDGLIGPHWSKGWIIEDCEVSNSKCCGISLGKYRDPDNDMYFYTKHVKSPTQMEARRGMPGTVSRLAEGERGQPYHSPLRGASLRTDGHRGPHGRCVLRY